MENLFSTVEDAGYRPRPAPGFRPRRIVLAKGSRTRPRRRRMTEQICRAYPEAQVIEQA